MKKIYSCMLAMSMALAANAADYYLIGGFNGWSLEDPKCGFDLQLDGSYVLDYQGTLTSGFKINDGTWSNDNANFGGNDGAKLQLGTPFQLVVGGGSRNIEMSENIENPHLVLDVENLTLTITGQSSEVVVGYGLWGNFAGGDAWTAISLSESNGKWTATNQEVGDCSFGIQKLDMGTNSQIDWISSAAEAAVELDKAIPCQVEGVNFTIGAGTYNFSFDPSAMTLTVTGVGDEPVTPPTPGVVELYLRGDMNGWGADDAWKFTTTDNVNYELANVSVAAADKFKIADANWGANNYGGATDIALNVPVIVAQGSNVNMNLAEGGEGLTFKFNINTLELVVVGEGDEPNPPTPPTPGTVELYLRGGMNGWEASADWQFTTTDNVNYELANVSVAAADEFKIADASWGENNYGGASNIAFNVPVTLEQGNAGNMNLAEGGENLTFKFNINTLELVVVSEGGDDPNPPTPPTPGDVELFLRGAMNDWGTSTDYMLTTTDNVTYTLDVESIDAGIQFKVANEDWSVNYGYGVIDLDTPVELIFGGDNMSLSQSAKNVKFTFNKETLVLTVTGDVNVDPVDYTTWKIAIVGDFNDWSNEANAAVPDADGIATITEVALGVGEFKIKAITPGGEIWHSNGDIVPLKTTVTIAGNESANMTVNPDVPVAVENDCVYTFKWNCATNEVYVTLDQITGVNGVETAEAVAVYFNMQGVQVKTPANGIYVKVVNGKASKVNVK